MEKKRRDGRLSHAEAGDWAEAGLHPRVYPRLSPHSPITHYRRTGEKEGYHLPLGKWCRQEWEGLLEGAGPTVGIEASPFQDLLFVIFFTATPHGQVPSANHPALQTGLTHSHHDIKMGLGLPWSLPPQNPVPQQAHTPSPTGTHPGLMLGLFANWLPALIVRYCSPLSVGCWVFLWHSLQSSGQTLARCSQRQEKTVSR